MRPPEFTGGNWLHDERPNHPPNRFNEAAGIHRRKPGAYRARTAARA